ncbi:hypothetical protein VZC37_20770 [Gordonia sp. LSe1-13]|uniref:Alkaline shock response membrane anchor protein AmaP n=1 Tax=Gordonia sesuvii TaxID=3116777 RepID=A0ABU7MIC0_9ACTN|nr:hypothetical protein [Gordonia sp. LSe1-13]
MNRRPAAWHRLTVGLVGVLLVGVGLGAILWRIDVDPVHGWIERIDQGWAARMADTDWWPVLVGGVLVVAALWGWRLVAGTIRPGKVDDLVLDGSDHTGTISVSPKLIATAVGSDLERNPAIDAVDAKATDDRGRKIIRLTVTAQATHTYDDLASIVGEAVDAVREALDGAQIHVQAFVHLEPRNN